MKAAVVWLEKYKWNSVANGYRPFQKVPILNKLIIICMKMWLWNKIDNIDFVTVVNGVKRRAKTPKPKTVHFENDADKLKLFN